MKIFLIFVLLFMFYSCGEEPQPKPDAFLALEYPEPEYEKININCPYTFEINKLAEIVDAESPNPCWINLEYKKLNGTIFITYKPVKGNLRELLRDAQNLPLQHTIKADAIEGDIYTNPYHDLYGMFYEVSGDAASQAQFYITDSVNHFLTGSVYFRALPNFDSLLPAAEYLKEDIRHLMETVRWVQPK